MDRLINLKVGAVTLLIIVTLLVAGVFIVSSGTSKEYLVVLGEDGFKPRELVIKQGDRIKFSTTLNRQFWPASDLHPTHDLYPDFDPKMPIQPNEIWTFRFPNKGSWGFHDHMGPSNKGRVKVE